MLEDKKDENNCLKALKVQFTSASEDVNQVDAPLKGLHKYLQLKPDPSIVLINLSKYDYDALNDILKILCDLILSNELRIESIPIASSCFLHLSTLIEKNPKESYVRLLTSLQAPPATTTVTSTILENKFCDDQLLLSNECQQSCWNQKVVPCYAASSLIYGLLHKKPKWLFRCCDDRNVFSNLLFQLWPLVDKMCCLDPSYSYHSMLVLNLWLKISSDYVSSQFIPSISKCILCEEGSYLAQVFSLAPEGQICKLLHLQWENPVKGVCGMVQQCFVLLLRFHEQQLPGHGCSSSQEIVSATVQKRSWEAKATYALIEACLPFYNPTEVLDQFPSLPHWLCVSLKTSQLAAHATSLYKSICNPLSLCQWLEYFESQHWANINSNISLVRHHYLTMWFPWTLKKYPDGLESFVKRCDVTTLEGVHAKAFILMTAKSQGLIGLGSCRDIISQGSTHQSPVVRGLIFKLIVTSKKMTQPLNAEEIELIKEFFEENVGVDCPSFRNTFIQNFNLLYLRLKTSLTSKKNLRADQSNEFLRWLMTRLDHHMSLAGNYSRICTAILLFKALVDTLTSSLLPEYPNPNTLLVLCTHNMADVRQVAALLCLDIQLVPEEKIHWHEVSSRLRSSPRWNETEAGANLFRVLLEQESTEQRLEAMHKEVLRQFRTAQTDMVKAAFSQPIFGSILALNEGLKVAEPEVASRMLGLVFTTYAALVHFILKSLGATSGTLCSPSFYEMSQAIEKLIVASPSYDCSRQPSTDAISLEHQMVISLCWQVLKVCCLSLSDLLSRWGFLVGRIETIHWIDTIVLRVLHKTRHKGAMEAAQDSFRRICFNLSPEKRNLLQKELTKVVVDLPKNSETSVTRRAAGLAMIFSAACESFPKSSFTATVAKRLLVFSQLQENDSCEATDSRAAISLHILGAIVSNSAVDSSLVDICISCLQAFSSPSWALRNAALQVWGSLVRQLVGQKKVKDDSAPLNSITATEFCRRHRRLLSSLLEELEKRNHSSASLVPVLCLLCRFNSSSYQQERLVHQISNAVVPFLDHSSFAVRKLTASTIVALMPLDQLTKCIYDLLEMTGKSSNLTHGLLILILAAPPSLDINAKAKTSLMDIFDRGCPFNQALVVQILKENTFDGSYLAYGIPGSVEMARRVCIAKLQEAIDRNILNQFLEENFSNSIETFSPLLSVHDDFRVRISGQKILWVSLTIRENHRELRVLTTALRTLVSRDSVSQLNSNDQPLIVSRLKKILLQTSSGLLGQNCLVLVAHLLDRLPELESIWLEALDHMSAASSSEDSRICSVEALSVRVSIDRIATYHWAMAKMCLRLLQDQDATVRSTTSSFVTALCKPETNCVHPAVGLRLMAQLLVDLTLKKQDPHLLSFYFTYDDSIKDESVLYDNSINWFYEQHTLCRAINEALTTGPPVSKSPALVSWAVSFSDLNNNKKLDEDSNNPQLLVDRKHVQKLSFLKELKMFLNIIKKWSLSKGFYFQINFIVLEVATVTHTKGNLKYK